MIANQSILVWQPKQTHRNNPIWLIISTNWMMTMMILWTKSKDPLKIYMICMASLKKRYMPTWRNRISRKRPKLWWQRQRRKCVPCYIKNMHKVNYSCCIHSGQYYSTRTMKTTTMITTTTTTDQLRISQTTVTPACNIWKSASDVIIHHIPIRTLCTYKVLYIIDCCIRTQHHPPRNRTMYYVKYGKYVDCIWKRLVLLDVVVRVRHSQ